MIDSHHPELKEIKRLIVIKRKIILKHKCNTKQQKNTHKVYRLWQRDKYDQGTWNKQRILNHARKSINKKPSSTIRNILERLHNTNHYYQYI